MNSLSQWSSEAGAVLLDSLSQKLNVNLQLKQKEISM